MPRMPEARSFVPIDIAVLTVSDTRTEETDTSGRLLVSRLEADGHRLAEKAIVPDDMYRIRACVSRWIADPGVRAVVATGGTGLTGRDGTPEAVRPLLDKEIGGFGELFRSISYEEIGTFDGQLPRPRRSGQRHPRVLPAGLVRSVPDRLGPAAARAARLSISPVQPHRASAPPDGALGMEGVHVRVQPEPFDTGREIARLYEETSGVGAVASFLGVVRNENDDRAVGSMLLEHYPGMTERAIEGIVRDALARWPVSAVTVIHRVGALSPGDPIVLVAAASSHRGDAFQACEFIMDFLKTRAPLWKKESTPAGERWVGTRGSDFEALERW